MADLKQKCVHQLTMSFTPSNIIAEIASPFFETFSNELRHHYVDYLRENRLVVIRQRHLLQALLLGGPWSVEAASVIDEALNIHQFG